MQIEEFTSISSLATIGFGVTIKAKCCVGHHTIIRDYVTINPGVTVSGLVEIGQNTFIGTGSLIRDGITIGKNGIIGMGSNVVSDIPDKLIVRLGNPCKVQRINNS